MSARSIAVDVLLAGTSRGAAAAPARRFAVGRLARAARARLAAAAAPLSLFEVHGAGPAGGGVWIVVAPDEEAACALAPIATVGARVAWLGPASSHRPRLVGPLGDLPV